jgi:predicted DNA-binding ribbon-helix-helix protein
MSVLSIRLSDSLHNIVKTVAAEDSISINQFIASAVAEKISALTTEKYLAERTARASKARFDVVIANVPSIEPDEIDRIN